MSAIDDLNRFEKEWKSYLYKGDEKVSRVLYVHENEKLYNGLEVKLVMPEAMKGLFRARLEEHVVALVDACYKEAREQFVLMARSEALALLDTYPAPSTVPSP